MKNVIVGTAGHIDHGKTALVKALTGVDCDRWEEEKRRGITIDIGFAGLDLDADIHLGFVDVPGHERFVKNMLAGAHGIDLLMLVVAADESIMPQTREHFEIAKMLEVKSGLTVITKMDLVDESTSHLVVEEVREFLKNSFLGNQPIVCVSSMTGAGLEELRTQLHQLAQLVPAKNIADHFRLPIDRAFSMKGFGAVVTGTLVSGRVKKEDEVEILPERRRARVRGIQVHNLPVSEAAAGQRTAINLQGIEVNDLKRGMVLAHPGVFIPTLRLDVELSLLASAPAELKSRDRVHFHLGTSETIASVHLFDQAALRPGETAYARLALPDPTVALPWDHFVIRRLSPLMTIGGGTVLDPLPSQRGAADNQTFELLNAVRNRDFEQVVDHLISQAQGLGITRNDLIARTGLREDLLRAHLESLTRRNRIHQMPTRIVSSKVLAELQERLTKQVREHHARSPLTVGISKQELRERWISTVSDEVFAVVLALRVSNKRLAISKDLVHEAGRNVTLSSEEDTGKTVILDVFRSAGLKVPPVEEVLSKVKMEPRRSKQIVQLLVREGALIRVTSDLMFHKDSIAELREKLIARRAVHPKITVGEFKGLTGVTRKYAIPLLEYFDRERITRREGDSRVIL